jgi:hypothetical protein
VYRKDHDLRVCYPFDTNTVSNLDWGVAGVLANGNDFSNTLVASNERNLRWDRPVALGSMEIGMAHPRAMETDEAFARSELVRLLDWVVISELYSGTSSLDDGSLLNLGDRCHSEIDLDEDSGFGVKI